MPTCPAALARFSPVLARNWEQRLASQTPSLVNFFLFPQAVPHLAPSWLCASVQWCVGSRVIGPY